MGQVLQGGAGQAPARQAAVGAGLPIETPADTINKVCASSIRAVQIADLMIGPATTVVVAGGMESMSNAPHILKKARFGYRLGDGVVIDMMIHDGLTSTFDKRHMVEQASFVSRERVGLAAKTRTGGRCARTSAQCRDRQRPLSGRARARRRGAVDEDPRRDTSYEKLSRG